MINCYKLEKKCIVTSKKTNYYKCVVCIVQVEDININKVSNRNCFNVSHLTVLEYFN